MYLIEHQAAYAAQQAIRHKEAKPFVSAMQDFLKSEPFQKLYGASRTYYRLFGDAEPVEFLSKYIPQADQPTQPDSDEQKKYLSDQINKYNKLTSWLHPYTMAQEGNRYYFALGHKTNEFGYGYPVGYSRGFMITLKDPLKNITIFQQDPGGSRTLYERDSDPNKRNFMTILLNLLLSNAFNASESVNSQSGGIVGHKMILLCDHSFHIEHAFLTERPYFPNCDGPSMAPITSLHLPWKTEFDVLI
jgi:hypothetical protein